LKSTWKSGAVFERFKKMVAFQKGDLDAFIKSYEPVKKAFETNSGVFTFSAPYEGKIEEFDG